MHRVGIMLKWLAILGVFLAAIQTASPTPRETSDHPAGASGGAQHNSQTNQSPAHNEPPVPQPIQSVNKQYDGSTKAGEDKPQPIAIREFPPVSIMKDWADKSYWAFSGLLVLVGGFQVWLLWRTLGAISKQTTQLERQVQASHDGLRAWIGIEVRENQFTVDFNATLMYKVSEVFNPSPPRFVWEIKNHGQTPAFIKTVEVSNAAYSAQGGKLVPGKPLEVNGFLGAGRIDTHVLTLPDEALNKCELGQMFWRVSVKVGYDDAFKKEHDTMFSFHYNPAGGPVPRGFYQDIDRTTNYYN
jgi:hypothetical protein